MNKILYFILILTLTSCTSVPKSQRNYSETKADYLILKGTNLKKVGKYSEALGYYEKVLLKEPSNILALKELGETYSKLENFDAAVIYYKKVLEINPKDGDSSKNLAYIYYMKKDYKTSLFYLENIYDRELDLESKKLKSYLYFKNNRVVDGKNYAEKIEESIKKFDKIYYETYNKFLRENNIEESIDLLERIQIKYYEDINAINFYFYNMIELGNDYTYLEKELKKYIVTHEKNDDLYLNLADLEFRLGNYEKFLMVLKFVSDEGKLKRRYKELKSQVKK